MIVLSLEQEATRRSSCEKQTWLMEAACPSYSRAESCRKVLMRPFCFSAKLRG